jgi:hypothetical protein
MKKYTVRTLIVGYNLLVGHADTLAEAQILVFREKAESAAFNWDLLTKSGLGRDGLLRIAPGSYQDVYTIRDNVVGRVIASY